MAVTVKQKEPEQTEPTHVEVNEDLSWEQVSNLAAIRALDIQMKPLKEQLSKLQSDRSELEQQVLSAVDHLDPAEEVRVEADGVEYRITPQGRATEVTDPQKAIDLLEQAEPGLAYKLVSFPITKLREYLGKKQLEQVTETVFKSKRSIKYKDT